MLVLSHTQVISCCGFSKGSRKMAAIQLRFFLLRVFLILFLSGVASVSAAPGVSVGLSEASRAWIAAHQGKTFSVGFDPLSGMDVFEFRGKQHGFLPALLADMQAQLGLRFTLAKVAGWDDAYSRFVNGRIDILYGANPTPEREQIMRFTRPAWRYPYIVFARKDSIVQTLGDLDSRRVGFISNDFVIEKIPREYRNITYLPVTFQDQEAALKALVGRQIDGVVTSGGGVEYEFLYKYPELALITELASITSDMTFAVHDEQVMLASIIDTYLAQRQRELRQLVLETEQIYNRKIMYLNDAELAWLEQKGEAVVGVAEDYLPFDYFQEGEYRGIAGEVLRRIAAITGIRFKVVSGPFAHVYNQALSGSIDVLNIAKTEERQAFFLYPRPISTERDIIVGRKDSRPVQDVYGLEGLRVAVIDGFWHEEYLRKNLKRAKVVKTADIIESLRLLREGRVDYLIENPTVVEYYINGLGYTDLVKRGNTSKDSFVYFGVNRNQPELASIIDKALALIKFEDVKFAGIQSVPTLRNEESMKLTNIVIGLLVTLLVILFVTVKIVSSLVEQKAQTQILKEREHLLYIDALTGFYNRNYFSHQADALQGGSYPQALLMADLNNLKRVNDASGHAAGDALIAAFSRCLRSQFPTATLFRMGGDEFLAIVDDMSEVQIVAAIEQLQQRCAQAGQDLPNGGGGVSPSAAIGYAIRNSNRDALDPLIAEADERMYQIKAQTKKRRAGDV